MTYRKKPHFLILLTTQGLVGVLLICAVLLAGRTWLIENPQNNPWAPLDLRDAPGWLTAHRLAELRGDMTRCHAVLARSGITFTPLPETGEGACVRPDRMTSSTLALAPANPQMTCPVAAGLALWLEHGVQPLAEGILGSRVRRVVHLGTFSCRRMYDAADAPWSEHATGNAIDIAGFVLDDGRTVSVLAEWSAAGDEARFLQAVRDSACESFGTVLSPDYNAAHADHLHLDQGRNPGFGACR